MFFGLAHNINMGHCIFFYHLSGTSASPVVSQSVARKYNQAPLHRATLWSLFRTSQTLIATMQTTGHPEFNQGYEDDMIRVNVDVVWVGRHCGPVRSCGSLAWIGLLHAPADLRDKPINSLG